MRVAVVVSRADAASLTIRDALLAAAEWKDRGAFREGPRGLSMAETPRLHLDCDGIDADLARAGVAFDAIVFASRHQSAAGRPSYTVHPVGNWGDAEHGGRAREFSPAPARLMARLLRALAARAPKSVDVTYEATHHGPLVGAPACFLEIGSAEDAWKDPERGRVVAEALLEAAAAPEGAEPVLLALGGGHYVPRATDLARKGKAAFAHMTPLHHLPLADEEVLRRAVEASPGADGYYVDRRHEKEAEAAARALDAIGLARVDS